MFAASDKQFYISTRSRTSGTKMQPRKLPIALVGCGGIMGAHLGGYRDLYTRGIRVFDIRATCDTVESMAREKAEAVANFQESRPKVYTNLEEVLRNQNIEAVDIGLPHNIHHTIASKCLEEGLDVIIEKPLAITMRAAKVIIEKAQRSGRTLAVAENYRRSPANRAIWWAIREGLLGDPRMIMYTSAGYSTQAWGWRESRFSAGGSWVFDGGVHIADLDRYQIHREAIDVYAVQDTFDPVKNGINVTVDDMTMAIIRYEGRVYSQWIWTRAAPGKSTYSRIIHGSKGSVNEESLMMHREGGLEVYGLNNLIERMNKDLSQEEKERMFPGGATDTFSTELHDFYDSIVNKRKPEVDGHEAYKDMAITLGFYESAVSGRPIRVSDVEELVIEEYQKEINEKVGI